MIPHSMIVGQRIAKKRSTCSSSTSSRISTSHLNLVLDSLKGKQNRSTTINMYHKIWRQFNAFLIKLNRKPEAWEDRVALYCSFLVEQGAQSSTLCSYISAIKSVLRTDGYQWDDGKVLLSTITKACKIQNDRVKTRLPINVKLLELLIFEKERYFSGTKYLKKTGKIKYNFKSPQPFLECMYKALFMLAYYGLMRIGELTTGTHPIKACNIHMGQNKRKILILLYSSKTHGKEARPQQIKISAAEQYSQMQKKRHFCPFKLIDKYLQMRGPFTNDDEPLFVFRGGEPVQPSHVRKLLRTLLTNLNLNSKLYDCHSWRLGRSSDLYRAKFSVDQIRRWGRWRSNTVFGYIRNV